MSRYFIKLSYDGTHYHGWQSQDNAVTIQSGLEKALSIIISEEIEVTGAGRTDTGVHAREYFAHFDLDKKLSDEEKKDIVYRLNAILSKDISVSEIIDVEASAHARFSAVSRTYKYYISKTKNPFNKEYSWFVYGNIDVVKMKEASKILFEYTDFTSFSKLHTDVKTNNCKIMYAEWNEENDMLIFTIKADRFLRNMVRAIVGTLVDVGKGKISLDDFRKIIENKNRSDAGYSVPAKGLFLEKIEYPFIV
ncbi:MAG TPA: tRNA pseudouridine(38-40) synthase TruA [Bacteroidales bacterium]|nr:tRNA pseudouridine(38-40) synthase TruA [Bacteroidales bacterium]HPS17677.1 tRNA pseudouridine(38-40) synthase TruA [Bacteroidales bacterium]